MCTLHGWIYRVILEEAALEGRSRKRGKKKKRNKERKEGEKRRKKESLDPSRPVGRRWVFLIGHGKTRACGGELWIVLAPCSFYRRGGTQRERERGFARCVSGSIGGKQATREGEIN